MFVRFKVEVTWSPSYLKVSDIPFSWFVASFTSSIFSMVFDLELHDMHLFSSIEGIIGNVVV